ncbi:MAG: helix-turn-helix transcriptional regulator [Deltaproteobacteria bacterium]|nr:helix-turn-helix transcriptional regulator [Deltaproteobacteria bacterium]
MNLGALIRKNRKERKLTLKTVAEKAGVSEGFLSQVENSVSSPSVDTLVSICAAMGVSAGDLLNQAGTHETLMVIHKEEWDDIEIPKAGFVTRRFIPPESRSIIDSAVIFLNPETSIPVRKNIKNGQEVLCVLRGSLELLHGDQTIPLSEGDAAHFYANPAKQYITNNGKEVTVVLWVGTA